MAKSIVLVLGIVMIVFGAWGFFNSQVLGVFGVDAIVSSIHLIIGVLALIMASAGRGGVRNFGRVFGVVYLVLGLVALLFAGDSATVLGLYDADTALGWLHVIMGVLLLYAGFAPASSMSASRPMSGMPM